MAAAARVASDPSLLDQGAESPDGPERVGDTPTVDARSGRWLSPRPDDLLDDAASWDAHRARIRESWTGQLAFAEERREHGRIVTEGLRAPQIGALHAVLAHWTVTTEPATIVMPTGTGKTETMLALLVAERPSCLLVVVPTDALRNQIAAKFESLGVLRRFGVILPAAAYPIVGTLRRRPRHGDEVRAVFGRCNVVVTTMAVAGGCTEDVQRAMAEAATHLVIDEAHHISARTWAHFRRAFARRPILQFTATPFRRDRKHVDGRVVYHYPLRKAQEEGLFKRINFRPVAEYDEESADVAIARTAAEALDEDLARGFDHLIMARASTIARATAVHGIYAALDVERVADGVTPLRTVLVHSDLTPVEHRAAMRMLGSREARVVVCVDMFGEGFDMPELKVAALHDVHRSLAITLQFTGRFTRVTDALGDATMVANVLGPDVGASLRALYAEDADWNAILRELSTGSTTRQAQRADFLARFNPPPAAIALQNVFPQMSTVIYRTRCSEWRADRVERVVSADRLYGDVSVNESDRVAIFVTREAEPVAWGDLRELVNVEWDVYLLHWSEAQQLLFIFSSNNGSLHEGLAKAVGGDDVTLVRGEPMFRGFHDVHQLILMNLGLKHALSRNVQFTMYVGSNILEALSEASQTNRVKSNMFGRGYTLGTRTSYGCSYKGRVWSHRRAADIAEWMEWCHVVGTKVTDESITPAAALRHVLVPTQITQRPYAVPIAIVWPDDLLDRHEDVVELTIAGVPSPLFDVSLELVAPDRSGPIRFRVFTDAESAEYEVAFTGTGVEYRPVGAAAAEIRIGRRSLPMEGYLQEHVPAIYFADASFLLYDALFTPRIDRQASFTAARIESIDWTGIDLKKESQGPAKDADSVQRRVIEWLLREDPDGPYDVIFDDDGAGEAADVVALRVAGPRLLLRLIHCKFSKAATPGHRVKDLYEVCGQSQRSGARREHLEGLLDHLERREAKRLKKAGLPSRFEAGDRRVLRALKHRLPELTPELQVVLVQPGLARSGVTADQLDLLAVTEHFLRESYDVPLRIIGSA